MQTQYLPNLPVGRQYLAGIRSDDAIYVDKTEYIFHLCRVADTGYFLSRPRRFGKSLTLDTIHEIFNGNKALFKGLWIEDKWDWTQSNPVIRLSLDAIGHEIGLSDALTKELGKIALSFKLKLKEVAPGLAFKELIEKVAKKTGKKVVILIDEYDKPIVDYIDPYNLEIANNQRKILKNFFSILKDSSRYTRLLFITGVSKFSKVSIFSDLNHLSDLTLNPDYAALCGYTQEELEHNFEPYSWDAKTFVYNPFSVLNFFKQKTYSNFWFASGTPTFLTKLLRKKFQYRLEEVVVGDLILESFTLEKFDELDIDSLLLQTGYLTIKKITPRGQFILNYPNYEVKKAFGQFLLSEFTHTPVTVPWGMNILEALDSNDLTKAIGIINALIQSVPDQNYVKSEEKFFHALIHLVFTMIGTDVRSEVHTPIGRIDTVVITADRIFLFEFKIDTTAKFAIQTIKERNYAANLRLRNKPITAVGVAFSAKTKGIDDWAFEDL
jgi:hypothetical protein